MPARSAAYAALTAALWINLPVPCRAIPPNAPSPRVTHSLYQISVLDAFLSGVFDGAETIADLKRHGDFGIGSFNGADGELIALGGTIYQVRAANGRAAPAPNSLRTPFACVHFFHATRTLTAPSALSRDAFEKWLDARLPTLNGVYGVHINSRFAFVRTRAIPPTDKRPYPTLASLIPTQKTFDFHEMVGDFVGYRLPAYLKAVNVPGYHFHFLTGDRTAGGHVLDYTVAAGTRVEIDELRSVTIRIPDADDAAFAAAPLDKDRTKETKAVEEEPGK